MQSWRKTSCSLGLGVDLKDLPEQWSSLRDAQFEAGKLDSSSAGFWFDYIVICENVVLESEKVSRHAGGEFVC